MQYLYIKISININLFRRAVIAGPQLAAPGFALLLRHLFVDRINLSLGVNVVVSKHSWPDNAALAADATLTARGPLLLCRIVY